MGGEGLRNKRDMTHSNDIGEVRRAGPGRVALLRRLNRLLPLNDRYYPVAQLLLPTNVDLRVAVGTFEVIVPRSSFRAHLPDILGGIEAVVPDFALIQQLLGTLRSGYILDIGANAGGWALLCGTVSSLPIIAFEPEPTAFRLLQRNLALNARWTVDARPLACGIEDGAIYFHTGFNGYTLIPGRHVIADDDPDILRVDCTRVDTLFPSENVAFMKIDVEGFEWQVLQGACQVIERCRPPLIVEIHPPQLRDRGRSTEEVYGFLRDRYADIRLFMPIPRPAGKLARLLGRYAAVHSPLLPLTERTFFEAVVVEPLPPQVYAVCRP